MKDADIDDQQSPDRYFDEPDPPYKRDRHIIADLEHVPETKDQDDRGQEIVES